MGQLFVEHSRLMDYSVQVDIDLPIIAAIGQQSAGKSSLIEAISGITLPRAGGTCTRFVTLALNVNVLMPLFATTQVPH